MAQQPALDFEMMFDILPGQYIVMDIDDPKFTIITQNKAHAAAVGNKQAEVIGLPVLEAFPDTSPEFIEKGESKLVQSFRKVIKTKAMDAMPVTRYDIANDKGGFDKRYWRILHFPIFADDGSVKAILQKNIEVTDEYLATEKLSQAEQQLNLAADSGFVSQWDWDIATDKVYADKNLCELFGVLETDGKEGLPLDVFTSAIHPDDREQVSKEISEVIKNGGRYEAEYRTLTKKGIKHILARGRVEYDSDNKPSHFRGIILDITSRKEAELSVQESESRLQFMADSMPHLVWITKPDGNHEYFNQRWYEYTGTKPGDTYGDAWNQLFHPADQERSRKLWEKCLKSGEPYNIEYRLYHAPSSSYRWVIGRAMPFKNKSGKITKWYGTCTDIDEQKRNSQLHSFLANASDELFSSLDYTETLDRVAQLLVPEIADWCSVEILNEDRTALQQVALAHRDPKKVKWARDLRKAQGSPPLDAPKGVPNVIRTGKSEFYPIIDEKVIAKATKNKKERDLILKLGLKSAMTVPIKRVGETIGAITLISAEQKRRYTEYDLEMAEDLARRASIAITNAHLFHEAQHEIEQRRVLEDKLLAANEELEERVIERTNELEITNTNLQQSNRELEDFAYVASHDLQEPLRKIQAFSNLLEEEYGAKLAGGRDYVERMRKAAARMSTLIDDLLSFSRVTTKGREFVPVSLKTVAEEVIDDLEARINETNGTINIESLPKVQADPMQMRQLFQNIIGNALKFHKPDVEPIVTVTAEITDEPKRADRSVKISISDNGLGFDEKYLDRIFSVFQRLHGKEQYEGTGIGLAVCRKIVERHNGTITASSKLGKGATFLITLPLVHKETEDDKQK